MRFSTFFEKIAFSIWRHWLEQLFRGYVRLNYNYENYEKKKRKTDRGKIPPDIILEIVRAVKIHNLFTRQVALKFNMNYRALSHYCKKS